MKAFAPFYMHWGIFFVDSSLYYSDEFEISNVNISISIIQLDHFCSITCPVRLVNALLSTCCRQHLALKAASITTDDAEREEIERLVNRERGVVWADQERPERNDGGTGSTHLQPILSFSHLVSHQNTPCSEWRKVKLHIKC